MQKKELEVTNETGIHARPAATLVEVAGKFASDIFLNRDDIRANAKSIMNVMLLAAEPGAKITVETEGPDEIAAMEAIEDLFEKKFLDDD
jgi:phosphocarrier protein HPr